MSAGGADAARDAGPPELHAANKRRVRDGMRRVAEAGADGCGAALAEACATDLVWRGFHPLNALSGPDEVADRLWRPLHEAFPDLERRDQLLAAGRYEGQDFVGAVGFLLGTWRRPWLGLPPDGRAFALRYGEMHRVRDGLIDQTTCIIDTLDAVERAGFAPVAARLGSPMPWPDPIDGGGLSLAPSDPALSARSLAQALAMQATLGAYDAQETEGREGLLQMPQRAYWHPRMMWYGPAGIGTSRGLDGFVDIHQMPFRLGFHGRRGMQHYVRIGDGAFSATGGWPSVTAVHGGSGFMGLGPTGRAVTMRVMDFYHHDEGLIRENWVPIDVTHLLLQLGVDVFARAAALGAPRR